MEPGGFYGQFGVLMNRPYFQVLKFPNQMKFKKFYLRFNLKYLLFASRCSWMVLVLFITSSPFTHCYFWLVQVKDKKSWE